MKILFANPPCQIKLRNGEERYFVRAGSRWPFSVKKKREKKLNYLPFPFYLAYAAALLEKEGFLVEGLDAIALNQTEKEFLVQVKQIKPDLILFETSTPTINHDYTLVKKIKRINKKIVICLAGPHVSVFPKEAFKGSPVDFVFQREYELAFRDFCLKLREGKSYTQIPGLVFKKGKQIKINPPQLIEDINQLPFPARHLFPTKELADPTLYWDGFCQFKPAIQMHATRGCPFRCNFCMWNQVMYQNGPYRLFAPKRIVEEMREVQEKYGAREIYFDDDTFTANKEHVLALCREIRKRKLKIHWSVMGDAIVTDEEMVKAMSRAGCLGMKFGVESGNQAILRRIEKPVDIAKLKQFTHWCAKRKIKTHATFTFGLSGETKKTMEDTLNLAKELDVDSVQFSITTPFPGTRYYDEVKKKKLLLARKWEDFDGASQSVVAYENLKQKEVVAYCRTASGKWLKAKMKNPFWVWRQLINLKRLVEGQGIGIVLKRFQRATELMLKP